MKRYSWVAFLVVIIISIGSAYATSTYKSSTFPTRVEKGITQVQAPNTGAWGKQWINVTTKDETVVQEIGCGVGPVFVIKNKQGHYKIKAFNWRTGAVLWEHSCGKHKPTLTHGGSFGVRFNVDNGFYTTYQGLVRGPFGR